MVLHSESFSGCNTKLVSLVHRWFSRKLRLKVGLSTAYFKRTAVTESSMPTPRAKAAFKYLLANNKYYKKYWEMQKELLENDRILTISSFDLFYQLYGHRMRDVSRIVSGDGVHEHRGSRDVL